MYVSCTHTTIPSHWQTSKNHRIANCKQLSFILINKKARSTKSSTSLTSPVSMSDSRYSSVGNCTCVKRLDMNNSSQCFSGDCNKLDVTQCTISSCFPWHDYSLATLRFPLSVHILFKPITLTDHKMMVTLCLASLHFGSQVLNMSQVLLHTH